MVHGDLCQPPQEARTGKAAPQRGVGCLGKLCSPGAGAAPRLVRAPRRHCPCGWGSRWGGESSRGAVKLGRRLSASVGRGVGAVTSRGPWDPRPRPMSAQGLPVARGGGQQLPGRQSQRPISGCPPPTFQLVPLGKLSQGLAWAGLTTDNARGEAWEGTEMDWETPCRQARGQAASGPVSAGHEGASLRAPPRGAPQYTGTPSTPCFLEASARGSILTAGPYTEA